MKSLRGIRMTGGCFLFLVGCSAGAAPDVEVGQDSAVESEGASLVDNALSQAQVKRVLELVDAICADTWCSGDYNFGFRRLSCSRVHGTCTLTLQVFPREAVTATERSYWRSCKTSGFSGFGSLVDRTGTYLSLDDTYYDALSECTTRIVSHLR